MNNFRGFSKTTVPLRDINFFVGENSTGKTSLLALLDLLADPSFWFNLNFNAGDYEFGGYKDIVSVLSSDQSEFQIGLCKPNTKNPNLSACYMLHFQQSKDGLPELVRFSQLCAKYYATIRVSDKQIAGCLSTDVPACGDCGSAHECFSFLRGTPSRIKTGYKVIPNDMRFVHSSPIGSFPVILAQLFRNSKVSTNADKIPFPSLSMSFASMAPIRTKPKRTYDGYTKTFSPEGEHTPYVIRKRLPGGSRTNEFKKALEAFGKDSGLFETVGITKFGKDSAAPFELTITLSAKALRLNSVGYGVSQALPIIVELLTHGKNSWMAIQQPEVHLHPRAQAALGEVLFHAATKANHTLFVETHSDYLIDRFRTCLRKSNQEAGATQVIFFERTGRGNHAYPMLLDDAGEYPSKQPPGFRSFFLKEQKRILGV
jgi:hypothetical protein